MRALPHPDLASFLRPIAHRGLHRAGAGVVENTAPAFEAALARGYGIECDLRRAAGGQALVFHDDTLDRLVEGQGRVVDLSDADRRGLRHKVGGAPIMTFGELLDLVGGRVPLLVEVKGEWEPPDADFLRHISGLAQSYWGPLALMSFDPAIVAAFADLAPTLPRGVVSGLYRNSDPEGWWGDVLTEDRQERLSHLLESRAAAPHFYAYDIKALPTPVTRYVREVLGMPLFTWTVRTEAERLAAATWADAPIFEGFEP